MKLWNKKVRYCIYIFVAVIIVVIIHFATIKQPIKYERYDEDTILVSNRSLYEVTKDGKWYACSDQRNLIVDGQNVIYYIANGSDDMYITKNGDIYLYKTRYYEGRNIGTILNATSGDLSSHHVAILTDDGEIYVRGKDYYTDGTYNVLGLDSIFETEEFQKIENIPKVSKVVCTSTYTLALTDQGEVYGTGRFFDKNFKSFTKISDDESIIDIDENESIIDIGGTSNNILYFLTKEGKVKCWTGTLIMGGNFNLPDNIKSICVDESNLVAVDEEGYIYYYGINPIENIHGEYTDCLKITNLGKVDSAYCAWNGIVAIKGNELVYMPINRESLVQKFFRKINIFKRRCK